jgi:tetratricopeptide (TPR) repeat protein
MRPRAHPFWILLALVLVLAAAAGGCAAGGGAAPSSPPLMAEAAKEAMMDAPSPAPAASAAAAPGGAKGDEKPKGDEAKTWKRSQLGAHAVRVKIGDREELPVRSMQANVSVDGFLARVVLDLVVRNDSGGTYEGTLQLRLPEGASPYFFAFGESVLQIAGDAPPAFFTPEKARGMGNDPVAIMSSRADLWRGPREARMVPKEQAAQAYRDTVRRAVDPALVEWAGPSVFNARVFPLTAGRTHRIVVGYDVPLTRIGGDLEYVFDLPEKVGNKAVDIAVTTPANATVDATPGGAPVKASGKSWFRYDNPAGKEITLRVKKPAPAHLVAEGGSFFAADVVPPLAAAGAPRGADAALLMVDTSLSSNPDRMNVWLRLADAILRNNRDAIKRFNVLFFNVEQSFFRPGFVDNDDAALAALEAHAEALALEGATDLGAALRRAASPPGAAAGQRWDVFLLSDGAATWGESDAFTMSRALAQSGAGAVYAYQTGMAGTDVETLSLLARETGGALFSVTGDAEVKAASTAHRARPFRLLEAKVAGTSDVLLAGRPRFLFPGQTLRVVGRGKPVAGADLELTVDADGAARTVKVPLGEALSSPLATRAYGQVAVAQIEELLPATDAIAAPYARQFRVTGKTCSLLMLESEADYQRFGIRPENDAAVVAQSPAGRAVADALAALAGTLGDPKRAFLRWLDELPRRSGVQFALPPTLRASLDRLPESSFRVDAAPLAVKERNRAAIPDPIQKALASHHVEYDPFSAEAQRRLQALGPADALKALSSLVEESPGDAVLARDVGMSAMEWGLPAEAYHLFRRVAESRPFEPPTYRALAQSLVRLGKIDLAMAYFEVGLAGRWPGRFGDFHRILAVEYLELLRRVQNGELKTNLAQLAKDRYDAVASEVQLGKADLVVMITWNTDGTDVDLHVVEPGGEECFYGHRSTRSGGQLTQDVTQGYGPEMYVLPSAPEGKYEIRAAYFASDRNRASARTKVHVLVFEGWGTSRQRVSERTVVLEYNKQVHPLYEVNRGPSAQIAR